MAARPVKPKPAKFSLAQTRSTSIKPEQTFVDPLADVPLFGPVMDRSEIQPSDIAFVTADQRAHWRFHRAECPNKSSHANYRPRNHSGYNRNAT